jgi:hypothetical protein
MEASNMPLIDKQKPTKGVAGKTIFRNTTRCFKLTVEEASLLDSVASAAGIPRSEWMRNAILHALLLLVNVLRPLATGQKVSVETFDKLLDEISTAKHELAAKIASEPRR